MSTTTNATIEQLQMILKYAIPWIIIEDTLEGLTGSTRTVLKDTQDLYMDEARQYCIDQNCHTTPAQDQLLQDAIAAALNQGDKWDPRLTDHAQEFVEENYVEE